MAAIFRVKRRNDDEPLDALLIACKRRKTGSDDKNDENSSLSTVVKFVGTVKDTDENVVDHISKKLSKEELKTNFKQHVVDITDKARKETKESSAANRFKVINKFRSLNNSLPDADLQEITVIDVEDTASCAVKEESQDEKGYAYDLYYTANETDNFELDYHIETFQQLVFDSHRGNDVLYSDNNDSEDSNSESHWKNDYPDSDHSESSILEDDMKDAVERLKIYGEDSDLSSDDENDPYALDDDDVAFYGVKYAMFKAKFMNEGLDDADSSGTDSDQTKEMEYLTDVD